MDLAFIQEYISPITLAVCLCIGYIIKNIIPGDKVNRFLPLIVAIVGVAMCTWAECAFTPLVVCSGLISGLASTGLYEAFSQLLLNYRVSRLNTVGNADLSDGDGE